jgi:hypothetical protein
MDATATATAATNAEKGTSHNPEDVSVDDSNDLVDNAWTWNRWLHEYEDRKTAQEIKKKHLALTWRNLTVTGVNSNAVLGDNVLSAINPVEIWRASRAQESDIVS